MNVEELSMIGPAVDLETVDPIHKKRLLAFINHFVINTTSLLNAIAKSCEERFMTLEDKMQKLEASIVILESKLSSVPGLDEDEPEEEEQQAAAAAAVVVGEESADVAAAESEPEAAPAPAQPSLAPEHVKYVKMLQVGVPAQAVRLKLAQDGVDPALHEDILGHVKATAKD